MKHRQRPLQILSIAVPIISAQTALADGYKVLSSAARSTTVAVDGVCNLTEAVASMNQGFPVNSDCPVDTSQGNYPYVLLDPTNSPTYELAYVAEFDRTDAWLYVFPDSSHPGKVTIEAPGTVFYTYPGASVSLLNVVIQVKAGSIVPPVTIERPHAGRL
jgi:hypothetical protein